MNTTDKDREEARKILGNLTITVSASIGLFGKTKTIDFPQTDKVVESTAKIIAHLRSEAKAEAMRDDFRMDELDAVMYSVDKWLEGDALKNNPATRAADAREYALRAIESAYARGKAEALREAAKVVRAQKWPEDGTGRYDLFNRGVESAIVAILADEPKKGE